MRSNNWASSAWLARRSTFLLIALAFADWFYSRQDQLVSRVEKDWLFVTQDVQQQQALLGRVYVHLGSASI